MLKLDVYANRRDIFSAKVFGSDFQKYVNILKQLPSGKYLPIEKLWTVSLHDLFILEKDLKAKALDPPEISSTLQKIIDSFREWKEKTKEVLALKDAHVPEIEKWLSKPLMEHQRVAAKAFLQQKRLLLADQMGVGKTLSALAAAQYLQKMSLVKSCLVVCIASIKTNWKKEMIKFLKEPEYVIVEGSPASREKLYKAKEFFKIVNYELLRKDIETSLDGVKYDLVIVDEIHRIRSHRAKQSKAVKKLGKMATYRWGLTGTPIHNKLEDLFGIMKFIDPDLLGTWYQFDTRYIQRGFFGGVDGYMNEDEIRTKLETVMLRRHKEDVLKNLPEKVYNTIYVNLSKEQREFYRNCKNQAVQMMDKEKEDKVNSAEILASLTYAREVCDSTELVDPTLKISSKMAELQELVNEFVDEGRKVVVFTQFAKMAFIIQHDLKQSSLILHGGISTAGDQRQAIIDQFEKDPKIPVFITTTAGGEGINLQFANVVIFFDLPFNPQVVAQMEDRLHRKGQENTVNVVKLIAVDTVEERVNEILEEKQKLFDSVIEGDDFISMKQIMRLL